MLLTSVGLLTQFYSKHVLTRLVYRSNKIGGLGILPVLTLSHIGVHIIPDCANGGGRRQSRCPLYIYLLLRMVDLANSMMQVTDAVVGRQRLVRRVIRISIF